MEIEHTNSRGTKHELIRNKYRKVPTETNMNLAISKGLK